MTSHRDQVREWKLPVVEFFHDAGPKDRTRMDPPLWSGFCYFIFPTQHSPSLTVVFLPLHPPNSGCTLPHGRVSATSSAKARNHPLVNPSRYSHVIQIVFANSAQPARLIQIKNTTALNFRSFARFKPQRPGDVVEADAASSITQPPCAHRVVDALH